MRKIFLLFIVIVLVLLLVHFSISRETFFSRQFITDNVVTYVFEPVVSQVKNVKQYFANLFNDYIVLVGVKRENKQLSQTVKVLALQNQSLKDELQRQYDVVVAKEQFQYFNYDLLNVNLLGFDPFLLSKTAWIDAGQDKNIKPDYVLVTTDGLVGRVIRVYDKTSTVLLLIDRDFAVDAVTQDTRTRCLVRGLNLSQIQAKHLPFLSQVEFVEDKLLLDKGDELITSGLSHIYPGGISVGRVVDVLLGEAGGWDTSYVMPSVDFAKLNQVFVLVPRSEGPEAQ